MYPLSVREKMREQKNSFQLYKNMNFYRTCFEAKEFRKNLLSPEFLTHDIISEIKILNEIQICKVLRNQNAVIVKFTSKNYWTLTIINILSTASTITSSA